MVTVVKKGTASKSLKGLIARASKSNPKRTLDAHRFCGKVKFKVDGLTLQRQWRDDWE